MTDLKKAVARVTKMQQRMAYQGAMPRYGVDAAPAGHLHNAIMDAAKLDAEALSVVLAALPLPETEGETRDAG